MSAQVCSYGHGEAADAAAFVGALQLVANLARPGSPWENATDDEVSR